TMLPDSNRKGSAQNLTLEDISQRQHLVASPKQPLRHYGTIAPVARSCRQQLSFWTATVAPIGSRLYRRLVIGEPCMNSKQAASLRYSRLPVGATFLSFSHN